MKKSDYERQRHEHYRQITSRPQPSEDRNYSSYVNADVRAAEAAGVVWDTEELRLPARVQLTRTDGDYRTQYIVEALGDHEGRLGWKRDHEGRLAVLREMVRAYNLWGPGGSAKEELQKACNQYYGSVSALQHAIGRLVHEAETKEMSGC